MSAPALLVAIPFLAGAATALGLADRMDERLVLTAAAAAMLAGIAALASLLQGDLREGCVAVVIGCSCAGLSLGASAGRAAYHPPILHWFNRHPSTEPVIVQGTLEEDAARGPSGVSMRLQVWSVNAQDPGKAPMGGVRFTVGGALAPLDVGEWRAGRTIRAPVSLRRPSTYLNPGVTDQRASLARRGIALVGSVKSGALVEVVRPGSAVAEWAAALRAWTRARVAAQMSADARSAGVTTAVLVGDRSGLAPEDERRLQEAGTYHVIAISGGNIAILAVLALAVCRGLFVPSRLAAVLTACGLVFYGIVAAGAASVARAVTVAVLVLGARALDHRGPAINALAVAATAAVAWSPVAVFDAGFLLSFGATAGIVFGVPLLVWSDPASEPASRAALRQALAAPAKLWAATVCAEAALAPVAAAFFARVTFAGLLLNFAAIPLMTVVQCAGLMVVICSGWAEALAGWAGRAAHLGAAGLLQSARLIEAAPWLAVRVRPPVWWLVAAYYVCAAALLIPACRRIAARLLVALLAVMIAGLSITSRDAVPPPSGRLRLVILDVGQGDASVLQFPRGHSMLVDAGGLPAFSPADAQEPGAPFDIGDRVVVPALRALGISRLAHVVISHGDPDHLLGAPGVVRAVGAGSIWEGIPVPPHAGLRALANLATTRAMPWRSVQAGDVERFGDVEIRVLHPPLPDWERQRVRNEDSVVIEARMGRVSIVLPGDIGREGERQILPRLEPGRLVVLKAPHHGSATSSTAELLEALRPAAVVFSCGRDNRFGHPHPAVVERYRRIGAEIFSTAEHGAVFVETDGTTVEVRGWVGKRARFVTPSSLSPTLPPSPRASRRAPSVPVPRTPARAFRTSP